MFWVWKIFSNLQLFRLFRFFTIFPAAHSYIVPVVKHNTAQGQLFLSLSLSYMFVLQNSFSPFDIIVSWERRGAAEMENEKILGLSQSPLNQYDWLQNAKEDDGGEKRRKKEMKMWNSLSSFLCVQNPELVPKACDDIIRSISELLSTFSSPIIVESRTHQATESGRVLGGVRKTDKMNFFLDLICCWVTEMKIKCWLGMCNSL